MLELAITKMRCLGLDLPPKFFIFLTLSAMSGNLKILLDPQLLCTDSSGAPVVSFSAPGDLTHGHSCLAHLLSRLLQYAIHGVALEDHLLV